MNRRVSLFFLKFVAMVVFIATQYPPQSACEYTVAACYARNHTRWLGRSMVLRTLDESPITFEYRRNSRVLTVQPAIAAVDAWVSSQNITPKVLLGGAFIAALAGLLAAFLVHHLLKLFGKE